MTLLLKRFLVMRSIKIEQEKIEVVKNSVKLGLDNETISKILIYFDKINKILILMLDLTFWKEKIRWKSFLSF